MFSVYGRQIHRIDMNSWDNYCFDTNTFDLEKDKDLVGLDAINPLHQILAHRHMYVQDERGRKHRAFGHLLLEKGTSIATTATVLGAYAAFSPWLLLVPAATNAVDGLKQIALHFAAGAMIWDRAYHG